MRDRLGCQYQPPRWNRPAGGIMPRRATRFMQRVFGLRTVIGTLYPFDKGPLLPGCWMGGRVLGQWLHRMQRPRDILILHDSDMLHTLLRTLLERNESGILRYEYVTLRASTEHDGHEQNHAPLNYILHGTPSVSIPNVSLLPAP